jgi:hypothetical protein
MRFKILPKVSSFTDAAGVEHKPGDVVDLPSSYEGETWLERVDPAPVVAAAPGKIEPIAASEPAAVPLEVSPPKKRVRKVPRLFRRPKS